MCDVLVLVPGGGWATDTTGSLTRCQQRIDDLRQSNRHPKAVTRLIDRTTGKRIT